MSKISVLPANRVNDGINRPGDSTTVHVLDVFKTKKTSAFAKNYHRTNNLGDEGHFCNQIFLKC